ncbi:hypothetical protein METP3_01102 [Methanosarcinales archaeon]|nr:hypothetical protein METP3_01102 [Methanosarcinales archaeon]
MSYQIHPGIRASFIVFLFLILVLILIFVSLNIFGTAFRKLGFPPEYSVYFLFLSLLGGNVNLPVKVEKITITINLGGAVIPIVMSGFLSTMVSPVDVIIAVLIMTFLIHSIARPVIGRGIAIHALLPPFLAAATALIISPHNAPLIAYISGTLGCLIGIDLLNLKKYLILECR